MRSGDAVTERATQRLCSNCGLCMVTEWPVEKSLQSCVFQRGWLGSQEKDLFGRERSLDDPDEVCFGIARQRLAGRLRQPVDGAAWTGVITRLAQRAFESGLVEGVVTLHRGQAHWFAPEPVLARSTEEILAGAGNKPVVSPVLKSLGEAYRQGLRRVLVIGAGCHVHNLRSFKQCFDTLMDMEVHVVGIPCVSNVRARRRPPEETRATASRRARPPRRGRALRTSRRSRREIVRSP